MPHATDYAQCRETRRLSRLPFETRGCLVGRGWHPFIPPTTGALILSFHPKISRKKSCELRADTLRKQSGI